jgi:septal ring factor EnvC (AmiA/AmiB activator)
MNTYDYEKLYAEQCAITKQLEEKLAATKERLHEQESRIDKLESDVKRKNEVINAHERRLVLAGKEISLLSSAMLELTILKMRIAELEGNELPFTEELSWRGLQFALSSIAPPSHHSQREGNK